MSISIFNKNGLKTLLEPILEGVFSIQELDVDSVVIPSSYVKDHLNPKIWHDNTLNPEIRTQLLKIADEYIKYLDVQIKPENILFLGSMANYNWNETSDLDLHIVFDFNKISDDVKLAKDFFDAKGSNWKNSHDISLKGYAVELYVQEKNEENKSVGVYNLVNDEWIHSPEKEKVTIDKKLIKKKSSDIATQIEEIEKKSLDESPDWNAIYKQSKKLKDKIKQMRQSGLDKTGEFSAENLAFKFLRNNGYLKKLGDISSQAFDKNLSMNEIKTEAVNIKNLQEVIFTNKRRPQIIIKVTKTPDGKITNVENEFKINFPFKIGQVLNMNHTVWACNNHFLVDNKDTCPEKKVFGIKQKDIPQGHPLRMLYPSKFLKEMIIKEMYTETQSLNGNLSNSELKIKKIAKLGNLDISRYDLKQLAIGFDIEKEHGTVNPTTNVTNDDEIKTLKIAIAHLNEVPDYYTKLKKYVEGEISEPNKKENTMFQKAPSHKLVIKKSVDNIDAKKAELIKEFILDCCTELNIETPCSVFMTAERGGPITTTASYNPNNDHIWIYTKNRNMLADPLRSLAHEIRHYKQKLDNVLTETSGEDGSPHENEANSFSGYMIRKFGKKHRDIYE